MIKKNFTLIMIVSIKAVFVIVFNFKILIFAIKTHLLFKYILYIYDLI